MRSYPPCAPFPAAMSRWDSSSWPSSSWVCSSWSATSTDRTAPPTSRRSPRRRRSMLTTLSQVPAATSAAVGTTSPDAPISPPAPTRKAAVWWAADRDGGNGAARPVVFFYGAEFAPYAAAERWPLMVALSRFGTFGQLGLMQSSPSGGLLRHLHLHLLACRLQERLGGPADRRALQRAEPDRGTATRRCRRPPHSRRRPWRPTTLRRRRSPCSTSPTATCWSGRASPPRCWPG